MNTSETHATVDKNFSVVLDFFRWLSALIVVIGHSRAIFFVPWGQVERQDLLSTALYFVSGWGDYGVMMFFAISGFLIGGGAYEKIKAGDFSFRLYLINRFTRIYIVLLPALLLVWILDIAGLRWLNALGIFTRGYPIGALGIDTRDTIGTANFIYNLLMLQNVLGPPFGTAQPLWTLNWEWWSYMLAPFLLGLLIRMNGRWAILISAFLAVAFVMAGLGYALLWNLGILLALARFQYRAILIYLAGGICLLIPIATRATLLPANLATQIPFILSFVLLLSQLRHVAFPGWWSKSPNKYLADFSYSLYVLHTTILVVLMACLQTYFSFPRQLQPSAINYGKYLILLLVVYAVARFFARLTESNTGRLRKLIHKHVLGS
jgi:peptidoglycan/LPS O-acetylase OafA/YrhL